jgi:purine nucleoside permease
MKEAINLEGSIKHSSITIDMEFLCNMKITVKALRQKKNTSFNAQNVNVMDIQKHTVQNHMHTLSAEETITQQHVQNHQIHRPNVHCAGEIILQVTKDAKCTRI